MKRKLIGLVILALLLFLPLALQAATVGKFTSVAGNVDVTSPGQEAQPAKLGDILNTGDIIRTKSNSKCEISFPDGSILRMAENSRMRINEFAQEKDLRNATLNLFRGKIQNVVMAVTGDTDKQSRYEIRTPTAVTGVRGTDFFAYHQAGVSGAIFKEGTGYGYSLNRPQDVRTIQAGQAMIVVSPDVPPVVRPATSWEIDQHQKDTAPAEKPASEAKKEEEKKSEGIAAKTDEGKKEESSPAEKTPETSASADKKAGSVDTGGQAKTVAPQQTTGAAVPVAAWEQFKPLDIVAQTIQTPTFTDLSLFAAAETKILTAPAVIPITTTLTSGSVGTGAVIVVPVATVVGPTTVNINVTFP